MISQININSAEPKAPPSFLFFSEKYITKDKLTQWHFFMMGLLSTFIIFTANYK